MDDEWDKDNFDPEPKVPTAVDKWEGEDEDDDVKDNWEDEDEEKEEKKDVEKQDDDVQSKAIQVKKSKKISSEKIAEKERLEKEEMEKKLLANKNEVLDDEDDDEEIINEKKELTPEQRLVEKLRQQKLQEESDFKVAMETFGLSAEPSTGTGLESTPSTEEEFNEYQALLIAKLDSLSKSTYFPDFAEEIVRNISLNLPVASLKKLKSVTETICTEKLKLEKGDKTKKKGKGKAQLRLEGNTNLMSEYSAYKDLEDYEDFM